MRILVTGASGFVGQHVTRRVTRGAEHLLLLANGNLGCCSLDAPRSGPVDAIINLAAQAHVGCSLADPRATIENNVTALLTVLDYAREHDARVVHLSTDEALWPRNPYGASKAAQEAILSAYGHSYELDAVCVRADLIVGPGQAPDKFVPATLRSLRAGEPVRIYREARERLWQGATNAADALVWLATEPDPPRLCHLGGERLTPPAVADRLAYMLDVEWTPDGIELPPSVRSDAHMDKRLLLDERTAWRPPSTLLADLQACVDE